MQALKRSLKLENTGHLKRSVQGVARKLKAQLASKPSAKRFDTAERLTAERLDSGEAATVKKTPIKKLPFVKDTKGSRLALNLLLVRPWFLLAGFWVVSLVSAAVAWEGMISPKILTMDLPQQVAESTPDTDKNSFLSVEQSPGAQAQSAQQNGTQQDGAQQNVPAVNAGAGSGAATVTTAADSTGGFPTWPIGALVGTCAAGCLAISRRRSMVRMAAATRSQGKRRVRPGVASHANHQPGSKQNSPLSSSRKVGRPLKIVTTRKPKRSLQRLQPKGQPLKGQPTRVKTAAAVQTVEQPVVRGMVRAKKRRQRRRPATAQAVPMPTTGTPVLASRSRRSQAVPAAQSRPQKRRQPSVRGPKRNPSVVSVVPAGESHALDWRNGSLAHQLDVRPQRTASM